MGNIDEYVQEKSCTYRGELYFVRDNGAVLRKTPEGKRQRSLDNQWTFGTKNASNGYMTIGGHRIHIVVATAFFGERDSKVYVVDHIDTNRCNNRVENLRWLTRLENILLNELTRKKIEWICGSVERFLEDPSQLRGYESHDRNFEWMRTVSKEEAANTLRNWKTLLERSNRGSTSGQPIGDWIYGNKDMHPDIPLVRSDEDHYEEAVRSEADMYAEEERQCIEQERLIREQNKREERNARNREKNAMKKAVKEAVLSVAKANGWTIENNATGDGWKVDLMLSDGFHHIGIKLFGNTRKVREEYDSMKSCGVRGCWLGSTYTGYDEVLYPCFDVCIDNGVSVMVSGVPIPLEKLLIAIMYDSLKVDDSITVNKVKVRFSSISCYFCNSQHYTYFVNGVISEDYPLLATNEGMNDAHIGVDALDPIVVDGVKRFVNEHPEFHYPMGEIKERYSKTRDEWYMSFGCPSCDGLVGSWYQHDLEMNAMYDADDENVHIIELKQPGLTLTMPHWVIR